MARTELDAAALEAATMALLHKEKNPSPDVDWLASRNGTVTQWKERVYYAITAYLAAAPVAAQGTLCKPHSLPDCMWCRREAEAAQPAPGERQP